jgi:DNA-binding LytR/AlgR family response regulator
LPAEQFYRVNRQFIVHIGSIQKFYTDNTRRINLEINPAVKDPVLVSKNKAAEFKQWVRHRSKE